MSENKQSNDRSETPKVSGLLRRMSMSEGIRVIKKNTKQASPQQESTLGDRMNDAEGMILIKKDDPRHPEYQTLHPPQQTEAKQEKPKQ